MVVMGPTFPDLSIPLHDCIFPHLFSLLVCFWFSPFEVMMSDVFGPSVEPNMVGFNCYSTEVCTTQGSG